MNRIYLSPPEVEGDEIGLLTDVFNSNWISTVGPQIDEFEKCLEVFFPGKRVLALSSGTAAIQLALRMGGIPKGDSIGCDTFSFCALPNAILNEGFNPVFLDCGKDWNLDQRVLQDTSSDQLKAVLSAHCYGSISNDIQGMKRYCKEKGILFIEDAAEAFGAKNENSYAGGLGDYGVLSFNGNKIFTTGGGGALVLSSTDEYDFGLHLATQAKTSIDKGNELTVGSNFRMSNLLAAIGIAQIRGLNRRLARKREIHEAYVDALGAYPVSFQPSGVDGSSNHWLTTVMFTENVNINQLISMFEEKNIEVRRVWEPLHTQFKFKGFKYYGDQRRAETLFASGICLPSGTSLTKEDQLRVIDVLKRFMG